LLFGEGEYRSTLERLVSELKLTDSVEFGCHVPQHELFARISEASVFVLASKSPSDNLPNSVKEAMALGVPVITTPTTGINELVQDGVTGRVVPMGDVKTLASALLDSLYEIELARQLAVRAGQVVSDKFDLKRTTERRKRLFEDVSGLRDVRVKENLLTPSHALAQLQLNE
jgi:glycosyltransferase involved in cell wall biosynthesis